MFSISIQAGGQSSRMGVNKATMPFNGRPLIQRVWDRLAFLSIDTFVTSSDPAPFISMGLRSFPDVLPGKGALGGLITAFHYARYDYIAVVACDMPFTSPDLLLAEFNLLISENSDVIIPSTENGLEPLHAVYRVSSCLPPALDALRSGRKRLISWFPEVRVREMTTGEIKKIDPNRLSFLNVNTPEELKTAQRLAMIQER